MNNTSLLHFKNQENFVNHDTDHFAEVYKSPILKLAFGISYVLACFCAPCIISVIYYERSGYAGHYRTLVNQLASFNLDQVKVLIYYQ